MVHAVVVEPKKNKAWQKSHLNSPVGAAENLSCSPVIRAVPFGYIQRIFCIVIHKRHREVVYTGCRRVCEEEHEAPKALLSYKQVNEEWKDELPRAEFFIAADELAEMESVIAPNSEDKHDRIQVRRNVLLEPIPFDSRIRH